LDQQSQFWNSISEEFLADHKAELTTVEDIEAGSDDDYVALHFAKQELLKNKREVYAQRLIII